MSPLSPLSPPLLSILILANERHRLIHFFHLRRLLVGLLHIPLQLHNACLNFGLILFEGDNYRFGRFKPKGGVFRAGLEKVCIRSRSEKFVVSRDDWERRTMVRRFFSSWRVMSPGKFPFTTLVKVAAVTVMAVTARAVMAAVVAARRIWYFSFTSSGSCWLAQARSGIPATSWNLRAGSRRSTFHEQGRIDHLQWSSLLIEAGLILREVRRFSYQDCYFCWQRLLVRFPFPQAIFLCWDQRQLDCQSQSRVEL